MEKESIGKKLNKIPLEKSIYIITIVFFICVALYCAFRLMNILPGGFSSEVFMSPILMIKEFIPMPVNIIFLLITVVLIVAGVKNSKLWFLLPTGIFVISMYWFVSNLLVINLIKKTLQ
jgi:hypothetical protein